MKDPRQPIDAGQLHPQLPAYLAQMHEREKYSSAIHAKCFASDLAALPARWQKTIIKKTCDDILATPIDEFEGPAWGEYNALLTRLRRAPMRLDCDDADIRDRAEKNARHCADICEKYRADIVAGAVPLALAAYIRLQNVEFPKGKAADAFAARAACPYWWRRTLRRAVARGVEGNAIALGRVSKRADVYVSEESFKRRQMQLAANAKMLASMVATNEWAQEYTLAELAAVSTAARDIRRHELIIRLKGFEAYAARRFHDAMFVTLTCPSRFHAYNHEGRRNENHDETTTPADAQLYLRKVWSRIRAKLARQGVALYGFRIAEPHGDGTPHWHFVLFCPSGESAGAVAAGYNAHGPKVSQAIAIRRAFERYALEDSPDEAGAREHRVSFVPIDRDRGTATGYAIKYISKNIDGFRVGEWKIDADLCGDETLNLAPRVEAWAATWGIRQFQQIGGPAVGLWREFRRVRGVPEGKSDSISDEFVGAYFAANRFTEAATVDEFGEIGFKKQADFGAFMEAIKVDGKRWREPLIALDRDSGAWPWPCSSRYSEILPPKVCGLKDRFREWRDFGGIVGDVVVRTWCGFVPTLRHDWKIERLQKPKGENRGAVTRGVADPDQSGGVGGITDQTYPRQQMAADFCGSGNVVQVRSAGGAGGRDCMGAMAGPGD